MTFDRTRPYNDLPPLPPRAELETRAVLKRAIGARTALADLKGAGALIPNQGILLQTIGLQEARLSSEIENVVTTSDQLYRALADDARSADHATREVLAYGRALAHGFRVVGHEHRPLATRLFEELASIILGREAGVRRVPGTRLATPAGEVIYTPPDEEPRLRGLLANLEHFIHSQDDLDPLVRMAVMHYQFEAIHPFTDGNGRTGRIANILFLVEQGLLEIPVLYLSRFILDRKSDYYRGLREVTESGDWEGWIVYMLEAVETTARHTEGRIRAIRALMDDTVARLKAERPKLYSRDLVEVVFRHPYSKIRFLEQEGLGSRQRASRLLQGLAELGILQEVRAGREAYFLNTGLMRLLAG